MKIITIIAWILLIVGGLNWGLIGLANLNLIDLLVGGTGIDRVLYILFGLSAIFGCICCKKCCRVEYTEPSDRNRNL